MLDPSEVLAAGAVAQTTLTKPNAILLDGLEFKHYRAGAGLNAHGVLELDKSAAHYAHLQAHPAPATTQMVRGRALHTAVLEPTELWNQWARDPKPKSTARAVEEERAEIRASGREIIPGNVDDIMRMRDAVLEHPIAAFILRHTIAERSAWWLQGDMTYKARIDIWAEPCNVVADLKTAANASPEGFSLAAQRHGYNVQAYHYQLAWSAWHEREPDHAVFIVVQSEAPHLVVCYRMRESALKLGARRWSKAVARYQQALHTGRWPGYDDVDGKPRVLDLDVPSWAYR